MNEKNKYFQIKKEKIHSISERYFLCSAAHVFYIELKIN